MRDLVKMTVHQSASLTEMALYARARIERRQRIPYADRALPARWWSASEVPTVLYVRPPLKPELGLAVIR